jgi:hypothetical protein
MCFKEEMALMLSQALVDIPLPAYAFVFSCLAYLFSSLIVRYLQIAFSLAVGQKAAAPTGSTLDLAEKGSLKRDESLSDEEVFQLEKRAFFSRVGSGFQMGLTYLAFLVLTRSRPGYSYAIVADSQKLEITMPLISRGSLSSLC